MEESRHTRVPLDEITPSPEKGVYVTQEELKTLLGDGDVTVSLSIS